MTIKHLGGIFGRNPTFNEVTVDGGIYFEQGQTGNFLDDYEEGTFTPFIEGTSSSGTYSYSAQTGTYTKVGNLVTIVIGLGGITADVAGSGSLKISGIPFVASETSIGTAWVRTINFDGNATYLVPFISLSTIFIYEVLDNAAGGSLNVADIVSGSSQISITLTYRV